MASIIADKEDMIAAYNEVRDDHSETSWVVYKYNADNKIETSGKGEEYDAMLETLGDDERVFIYVRITTGDEMSKRAKFAFITWIGPSVGAMKKAKLSTDKAFVKQVITAYGKEFLVEEKSEITQDVIKEELAKAGGANYGSAR